MDIFNYKNIKPYIKPYKYIHMNDTVSKSYI